MKKKMFSVLLALVLVLSFSLVLAVPAVAVTLNIPSTEYPTIQAAVNAAGPGDTIIVAAGTYPENVTIPAGKSNLKLIGAGSDVTTISITSGIAIRTNAPITVEGFHIQGPARGAGTAIKVENATASGTADNPGVFKNNKVSKVNYGLQHGDWHVHHWDFVGNNFSELRIGIGLENMDHAKVIGNSFKDYKEGVSMGWNTDTAHQVEIKDNVFLGTSDTEMGAAIVISSAAIDIDVSGNDIRDSVVGVLIKNGPASDPDQNEGNLHLDTVHINYNNIYGNDMGVENPASEPVEATYNWWGHASGPTHVSNPDGMGDRISDNVDYDPWLTAAWPPPPTKADILKDSGVPGKGLDKAPGQQKPFNPDSKAGENAGKK